MAVLAVTNTFSSGASITASGHNTNFSDIVTWLNNRYNGTDTWSFMKVSSTNGNPVDVSSSASTTELSINNSATDGDPILSFELSGSQTHGIGVDDSDSDALVGGTTAITTNQWLRVPSVGAQAQFNAGTVALPGISIIGDPNTGLFGAAADQLNIVTNGNSRVIVSNGGVEILGASNVLKMEGLGSASAPVITISGDLNTGLFSAGANQFGIATAGVEVFRMDESSTATHTRMLVYDVDNAALERVTVGAADSGGAGFKLLRIPN